MIVALALALVLAPEDAWQKLAGHAFEAFAARTEAICPARQFRFVTPGDLDGYQEDFIATLPRATQRRLARVDRGPTHCSGNGGLSCPSVRLLEAMSNIGQLDAFAAFACAAPAPVAAISAYPARSRTRASTSRSASPAAGPTP